MKKVLWLIICLMAMVITSCTTTYVATAKYEVCYPDGTRSYEDSVKINCSVTPCIVCVSSLGTNYISVGYAQAEAEPWAYTFTSIKKLGHIASSTAPMRLLDYKVEKYKKKRQVVQKVNYNW